MIFIVITPCKGWRYGVLMIVVKMEQKLVHSFSGLAQKLNKTVWITTPDDTFKSRSYSKKIMS